MELNIDREFEKLCPPLSNDELRELESLVLADGCLDPIIVWANHDDTILDGHNRYKLCVKHVIAFKTKALKFDTRDEAKAWIIRKQCGRRNISESQRAMLAAQLVKLGPGSNQHEVAQICATTRSDAAQSFAVSERSVTSAKKVLDRGGQPLQDAVTAGEVAVSTAAAVAELPKSEQKKIVAKGPEAVKAAAKQVKADKRLEFDTAKLDKDLEADKKKRQGKPVWSEKTVNDAWGSFVRDIDKHCKGLIALYEQRHNAKGGDAKDYDRALRAVKIAQAACHNAINAAHGSFKMWKVPA